MAEKTCSLKKSGSSGGSVDASLPDIQCWAQSNGGTYVTIDKNSWNSNATILTGSWSNPGSDQANYIDGSNDQSTWTRILTNPTSTFSADVSAYRYIRFYIKSNAQNRYMTISNLHLN